MRNTLWLAAVAIVLTLLMGGYSRSEPSNRANTANRGSAETAMITIKGSDTMVHLVTRLAESYMNAHPDAAISVTGGGSGTGIAALLNRTTDLCMASRAVKPKETDLAKDRGITFRETPVARDGIAVVVHPENPVSELTLDQLRQIFNGTLHVWKQVGGPDSGIQVLSRESNSGTYLFFNEHVLKKDDYSRKARLMPSNASIVQSVSQDRWSIGYVGLGYAMGAPVKIVAVLTDPQSPAVKPSLETVRDASYPISRPLYLYTNGEPAGLARAFVDFALSREGQQIVRDTGYIPLK